MINKDSHPYLFVANREFALSLLVCIGKSLELLDRLGLGYRNTKLDVLLGVFVSRLCAVSKIFRKGERLTYVDLGVIWQSRQDLVQGLVHLGSISFEETTTSYVIIRNL